METVIDIPFSFVRFAERDYTVRVVSHRKREYDQSSIKIPHGRLAVLSVIAPVIIEKQSTVPIEADKISKIEAAFVKRGSSFCFIPFELHLNNIHTLNQRFKGLTQQAMPWIDVLSHRRGIL